MATPKLVGDQPPLRDLIRDLQRIQAVLSTQAGQVGRTIEALQTTCPHTWTQPGFKKDSDQPQRLTCGFCLKEDWV